MSSSAFSAGACLRRCFVPYVLLRKDTSLRSKSGNYSIFAHQNNAVRCDLHKTGFGATSGEPSSSSRMMDDPPLLHRPQKKNKRCGLSREILSKPGFGQNEPLTIPLGRSTLCALSLAACSPLNPPNDTPRQEALNQVMIQYHHK